MKRFHRIAAFASVSFVLFFIAKINKIDLYTAYFKTIADVEVRNSQDVKLSGVYLDRDFSVEDQSRNVLPEWPVVGPALVTNSGLPFFSQTELTPAFPGSQVSVDGFVFFAAAAPRAPTA